MAKTTIPVELSSTPGITDNSNATAITIDSSEDTTFTNNINVGGIGHVNLSGSASEVSVGVTGDTDNSGGGVFLLITLQL